MDQKYGHLLHKSTIWMRASVYSLISNFQSHIVPRPKCSRSCRVVCKALHLCAQTAHELEMLSEARLLAISLSPLAFLLRAIHRRRDLQEKQRPTHQKKKKSLQCRCADVFLSSLNFHSDSFVSWNLVILKANATKDIQTNGLWRVITAFRSQYLPQTSMVYGSEALYFGGFECCKWHYIFSLCVCVFAFL